MKIASMAVFKADAPESTHRRERPAPFAVPPSAPTARVAHRGGFADSVAAALDATVVPAPDGTPPPASDAERSEAVAQFTQALWQAIHESARSTGDHRDGERGHHDHGRRAHGRNRNPHGYAGLGQQIERLISRYATEVGAPSEADVEPAPMADPTPPVVADVPVPADASEEPSDRLPVPDPLMAAFRRMLEAFGVAVPTGDAGSSLAGFLDRLVDGLRDGRGDDSSFGGFLSVTA